MVDNESLEDKSYRVNGFCQRNASTDFRTLTNLNGICFNPSFKIKPILITSVDEFIRKVTTEIGTPSYKNPVFYRAHANSNYINVPSSLRSAKAIENENFMLREFRRRYPEQFSKCINTLEQLVVAQHYGSFSRCLDITESPLVALAFACFEEKKFNNGDNHKSCYSTITVFHAANEREDIKGFDSSTAGVMANSAKCDTNFKYGNLEIFYLNDGFESQLRNSIYFRHIISHSIIVRTKQDNPRIRNQRGAFILVNANEVLEIDNCPLSPYSLMDQVMKNRDDIVEPLNVERLKKQYPKLTEWDISFGKINPYNINNKYGIFKSDPFDLKRLYYKDKETDKQIVFFIPPGCKEKIRRQLESIGYTYDFLFPEVDTVFNEIKDKVIG